MRAAPGNSSLCPRQGAEPGGRSLPSRQGWQWPEAGQWLRGEGAGSLVLGFAQINSSKTRVAEGDGG